MSGNFIPISAPVLHGNEKKHVLECLESNWISAYGRFIDDFENGFAAYCGTRHAISCCNGTAALHLALLAAGIGPGDEVLVPTLTFVATANAVTYCGARPVFIDADERTWNMDASSLEKSLTPRTKAILPVHLYGHVADMPPILEVASDRGLTVIEDAAEALGARFRKEMAGSLADVATFSLFGNKIITSGEGGFVVTDDDDLARRARLFRGQGMDLRKRYWFLVVGHNYRMTNLTAAVGLGQLEDVDWHLETRGVLYNRYLERLSDVDGLVLQEPMQDSTVAPWLFSVRLSGATAEFRDGVMGRMLASGIETRPVFYPMHTLPPYLDLEGHFPVAERIAREGVTLPLWAGLTVEDVDRVCDSLKDCLGRTSVDG